MKKTLSIIFCFIICICSSAQSVSIIPGEVKEVRDREVIIGYTGELIPNVGDSVSIGFEIDREFIPYDAAWIIMEVGSGFISTINMNAQNLTPQIGYQARIKSKNPRSPTYQDVIRTGWEVNIISRITNLDAHVDNLRFFNTEKDLPKVDKRKYEKYFSASETQYICWQLNLRRPSPEKRINFKIIAKYFYFDGELIVEHSLDTYYDSDWNSSTHASGWGKESTNWWKIGKYYVQLYVNDQLIAHEPFFVY